MTVLRIVANIATADMEAADGFYGDILGLDRVMDHGWIPTYASREAMAAQISFASEGGSGTSVPDLSIEVDDLDAVLRGMRQAGVTIDHGPVTEPWGVRRFFVLDPLGKLVNILQHVAPEAG